MSIIQLFKSSLTQPTNQPTCQFNTDKLSVDSPVVSVYIYREDHSAIQLIAHTTSQRTCQLNTDKLSADSPWASFSHNSLQHSHSQLTNQPTCQFNADKLNVDSPVVYVSTMSIIQL